MMTDAIAVGHASSLPAPPSLHECASCGRFFGRELRCAECGELICPDCAQRGQSPDPGVRFCPDCDEEFWDNHQPCDRCDQPVRDDEVVWLETGRSVCVPCSRAQAAAAAPADGGQAGSMPHGDADA